MESFPAESGGQRAPSLAEDPALGLSHRAKLEILGAVLLALFLGALDQTIVGTALPRIVTDLGGNEYYTWVVTIYLLTSTITVPFYGKLSDLYGRKPMLMIGVTIFLVGSALSGLSQNMAMLIFFRGVQGVGAGALFPIALAVIGDLFTPAERGRYQGLFGAVFGISFIIGPALGGLLTDNVSWHWIFYVNIPVGVVSLIVLARLLPTVKRAGATRNLDLPGAAVFTLAISALLVGLTNKQSGDWADPSVGGLIAVAAILGAVFLAIEARAKEPIIPLGMFRNRTYAASILSTFLVSFGFFGAIIFLPQWFQVVAGASATESGYNLLPLLAALIISATVSGQIVARTGRYKLLMLGSMLFLAAGLYLMTNLRADTDRPMLWLWMAVTGLGIGPSFAVFTLIVQNAVQPAVIGVATSSLTFFQQIGGTIGLTIASTIAADTIAKELPPRLLAAGVPQQFLGQFGPGSQLQLTGTGDLGKRILAATPADQQAFVQPLIGGIVQAVHESFSIAIASTFWVSIVAALVAAACMLFLREVPMRETFEMTSDAEGAAPAVS
jgi:EmrB/QacA subfamily drug resistance transporter